MSFLYSEEETEDWLEIEMRALRMPDGTQRPLSGFRLLWVVFDELIERGYTPEQIVRWTIAETELTGVSFETAFPGVVAYIDQQWSRTD